jgi:hypothetical protein
MAAWVAWAGFDGPMQVLSFRHATGWHVESTGGIVTVLVGGADAVLEAGSYRVGGASLAAKVGGAVVVLAVTGLAALGVWRRRTEAHSPDADPSGDARVAAAPELAALATLTTLLVAAPLFSPQFLIWLTPWAAVAAGARQRQPALLIGAAGALTQVTLMVFSPGALDAVAPAAFLAVRNGLLLTAALWSVHLLLGRPGAATGPPARGADVEVAG